RAPRRQQILRAGCVLPASGDADQSAARVQRVPAAQDRRLSLLMCRMGYRAAPGRSARGVFLCLFCNTLTKTYSAPLPFVDPPELRFDILVQQKMDGWLNLECWGPAKEPSIESDWRDAVRL